MRSSAESGRNPSHRSIPLTSSRLDSGFIEPSALWAACPALQVATARVGERRQIAREMPDVLARRMSLVTVHAGALANRTDLSPAQTRETAAIIQTDSQCAAGPKRTSSQGVHGQGA